MNNPSQQIILSPENIIVRMPNWLGDLVMATPVLEDLHRHWPQAKITAMCQGQLGTVLQADPFIHEIFNFKKPSGWLHRLGHIDILDPLRKGQYDLGILLTNSLSSAWCFWRGQVKNRIGYAMHWRSWLLDYAIPPPPPESQHQVITYKKLLEPLGVPLSNTSPQLYLTEKEKLEIREWLSRYNISPEHHIIVGINPGAAYGSAKCWLPERFQQVTKELLNNPKVAVLFFGDKTGAPLVNQICLGMPERVVNLAGKTSLRELMAFIQACHIFLTNDSGPMHIASALGTPLLALFGSTSDVATGPYKGGKVLHKHVECSPCYKRECPIDFRCMTRIGVDEVYQELKQMLKEQHLE